ncbi:autotransporter-associated beta strand repeat-containing protein, partial [Microvirga rosea]|uniref:autotransporter-associated beta strand repeat-containing protein n=1 Tax=Microvirga rosea TaxID=2715425 RepID=UPI001D0B1503
MAHHRFARRETLADSNREGEASITDAPRGKCEPAGRGDYLLLASTALAGALALLAPKAADAANLDLNGLAVVLPQVGFFGGATFLNGSDGIINTSGALANLTSVGGNAVYSGTINQTAGAISIRQIGGNNSFLGTNNSTGGFYVTGGATIGLLSSTALGFGVVSLDAGTSLRVDNGSLTLHNPVVLNGVGDVTFDTHSKPDFTVSGQVSGMGTLVITGNGMLRLTSANTYTGGTTISEGTLRLGSVGTLGASSNTTTLQFGSVLDLGGTTQTQATLNMAGGTIRTGMMNVGQFQMTDGTVAANATINAGTAFDLQAGTVNGVLAGTGALTKTSPGTATLTNANTYSGGTSVLTGTLEIQNGAALGSGGVTLNGGHLRSNITGIATLANPLSLVNASLLSAAPGQTLNINLANVADGAIVLLGSA